MTTGSDWALALAFIEDHPGEAARALERVPAAEAAAVLAAVDPPAAAAGVLRRMVAAAGSECLGCMAPAAAAPVLGALPLDGAAGLLRRLDPEVRGAALAAVAEKVRLPLERLLAYPEGTAGALMDPLVASYPEDIAVGEALARARHAPLHVLDYLYIVDRSQALAGVLNFRELMLADPKAALGSVMRTAVARLAATADRAAILAHPGWREYHALPVVDDAGSFIGAVRYLTLRRLELAATTSHPAERSLATILSISELCWIGLTGMLSGLATSMGAASLDALRLDSAAPLPPPPGAPGPEERSDAETR